MDDAMAVWLRLDPCLCLRGHSRRHEGGELAIAVR
jgi:hypothetical protein